MMRIEAKVATKIARTFRVEQVAGMFDVGLGAKSAERFVVEVPELEEAGAKPQAAGNFRGWQLGAIVGPSGSGKSTVARAACERWGCELRERFDWPADRAVVDGFDEGCSAAEVTGMLTAVGFSSPPAWVRPYRVLSGGQRMRADLARALLSEGEVAAFDEFTSVVDRQVAAVVSRCAAKAVRSGRARCKRLVVVTCHRDVLGWLEPDWWVDMSAPGKGGVIRAEGGGAIEKAPGFRLGVHRLRGRSRARAWAMFAPHHYLSHKLAKGGTAYLATLEGDGQIPAEPGADGAAVPVGFCDVRQNPGFKGYRRVHRLVVLPDYQGIGIGGRLLEAVARVEAAQVRRFGIVTSTPGLIHRLGRSERWRCVGVNRPSDFQTGMSREQGRRVGGFGRGRASFEWAPGSGCQAGA